MSLSFCSFVVWIYVLTCCLCFFFFFQAEDGIRDIGVTGVQTCALPIYKAIGGWLREAGKKDRQRLLSFLDKHAATMPRTAMRYAIEHLDKEQRDHYLKIGRASCRERV